MHCCIVGVMWRDANKNYNNMKWPEKREKLIVMR